MARSRSRSRSPARRAQSREGYRPGGDRSRTSLRRGGGTESSHNSARDASQANRSCNTHTDVGDPTTTTGPIYATPAVQIPEALATSTPDPPATTPDVTFTSDDEDDEDDEELSASIRAGPVNHAILRSAIGAAEQRHPLAWKPKSRKC